MNNLKNNYNLFQIVVDIFYLTFFYFLLFNESNFLSKFRYINDTILIIFLIIGWIVISLYSSIYRIERYHNLLYIIKKLSFHTILFTVYLVIVYGIIDYTNLNIRDLLYFISTITIVALVNRFFSFIYLKKIHQRGQNLTNAIVIDRNDKTSKYINSIIKRKDFGYKLDLVLTKDNGYLIENEIYDLLKNKFTNSNYSVFYSDKGDYTDNFKNAVQNLVEDSYINFYLIPNQDIEKRIDSGIEFMDHLPLINLSSHPLKEEFNRVIKRLFDLIFSLLVCVILLIFVFPIITLLIKLDSRGPIFFIQKRRGLNGKEFDCFKFRTMRDDGTNSVKATVVNDSRVTKIGNFLRKTSLDEFPQFFNVLKGDMSIVGPRPHMISQDVHYSEIIKKYNLRNYVKPGITGLAQVKGYRGAINSNKDMEDRIITDIFYVRNWSLLLDIQIIYQTVVLIFKGDENAI